MTSLVLGTVQFGLDYGINNKTGKVPVDAIKDILEYGWRNGINELDTAQEYGNSEKIIGEVLRLTQTNFLIHSKFLLKDRSIKSALDVSLQNLKSSHLGFFYFHNFSEYLHAQSTVLDANMENSLGLGVSIYEFKELQRAVMDPIIKAIQIPVNLFDCSNEKIFLLKQAQSDGKKIYVRSIFLQGLFFMDPDELPMKLKGFREPLIALREICRKYNVDMMSLAMGFIKSYAFDGVIIGVDNLTQLKQNISSWDTKIDSQAIDQVKSIVITDKNLLLPINWN